MSANVKTKNLARPLVFLLLIALVFAGLGFTPQAAYAKSQLAPTVVAKVTAKAQISKAKAKKIALKRAGGGTVKKCKLDYEDGKKVYEIEVVYKNKKYSMDVRVAGGKITDYKVKNIKSSKALISASKAKQKAIKSVGGGKVVKCELDYEDGRRVYEIEIWYKGLEHELRVGAYDGKIYEHEIDD